MAKKIFMPKNDRGGGRSSAKLLLWPAIGLIVLVLLVTLIMQPKDGQDSARKPPSDGGTIVREIPRPAVPEETASAPQQPPVEEGAGIALQEPKSLTPGQQGLSSAPESISEGEIPADQGPSPLPGGMKAEGVPEFIKPEPAPQKPDPQLAERPTLEDSPRTQPQAGLDGKGGPGQADGSKRSTVASLPPKAGKLTKPAPTEIKPGPESARTAEEQKKKAEEQKKKMVSGGKTLFAVQVGSFKDKHNADEIRDSLQKKGYAVVMKTRQDAKLGEIYVVQLKPVGNKGAASTQMEQVKNEQKVQPMIIEVSGGMEGQ
jgi:cell division protein FtsN